MTLSVKKQLVLVKRHKVSRKQQGTQVQHMTNTY